MLEFGDDFARGAACFDAEIRLALAADALGVFIAEAFQGAHAALVTGAAGLNALADPHLLLGEFFVEQGVGSFFGSHLLFAIHQKAVVVARPGVQCASIQFDDFIRHLL